VESVKVDYYPEVGIWEVFTAGGTDLPTVSRSFCRSSLRIPAHTCHIAHWFLHTVLRSCTERMFYWISHKLFLHSFCTAV
jgi:hypothetical protein